MTGRIMIVEQDGTDPMLWRHGLADATGSLGAEVYVLNSDPAGGGPPDDLHGASLWVTAILLVRQAKGPHQDRLRPPAVAA
jgi:hypothetical protein